MHFNVLIVDDERMLGGMTAEYFNAFGVRTLAVATKAECLAFLKENQADLILLDINLEKTVEPMRAGDKACDLQSFCGHKVPMGTNLAEKESGFDLCKIIRESYDTPIFFVSARLSTDDMLIALNIGGDDYITKPYELNVLLAKIKARLKRDENRKEAVSFAEANNLRLDFVKLKAFKDGKDLELKAKEFKLLAYFIQNKNKVVSKDEILTNVWGDTYISDGALNIQIFRLREKIERNPNEPEFIKTVWGQGYIFEVRE